MKKPRDIPAQTFRHWGQLFQDKILEDEYGDELAHLFFLMAADVEFHENLRDNWDNWYDGPIH